MRQLIAIFFLSFLLVTTGSSHGSTPTPNTFAYGIPLPVSGTEPLYETTLPESVYHHVAKTDLSDLRIFNKQGSVVPHLIRPVRLTSTHETRRTPLPLFPIGSPADSVLPDNISVFVQRDSTGSIVDISLDGNRKTVAKETIRYYLLDCSQIKDRLSGLEIFWDNDYGDLFRKISLESSDDLVTWRPVATATLASLQHLDHIFYNRSVKLPPHRYRYLRLIPNNTESPLHVVEIVGLSSHTLPGPPPRRSSFTLSSNRQNADATHYFFDTSGFFPIDQIQVFLSQENTIAEARLFSGLDPDGEMREVWRGLLYYLKRGDEELRNEMISFPRNNHRYWKLELKKSETDSGPPPRLRMSYLNDRVIFLGSGAGPFTLAYGNPNIPAPSFATDGLLKRYRDKEGKALQPSLIEPGKESILGGPDRLRPSPADLPWKQYLLWFILVCGTGLVGKMALNLYKDLQKK